MSNVMQSLVDGWSAQWQRERSDTQMTLGELIARLEQLPVDVSVYLDEPHSYRGYYCDLAFERVDVPLLAEDFLSLCRRSLGETFEGYKGGDYVMGKSTPCWVAEYGSCGERLMAIADDGSLITEPENDE